MPSLQSVPYSLIQQSTNEESLTRNIYSFLQNRIVMGL